MIGTYINALLSIGVALLVIWVLFFYDEDHIAVERIGLGILGGCAMLSIGNTWVPTGANPFFIFYQWGIRAGLILYLSGRVFRFRRHRANNRLAVNAAKRHLEGRHDKS